MMPTSTGPNMPDTDPIVLLMPKMIPAYSGEMSPGLTRNPAPYMQPQSATPVESSATAVHTASQPRKVRAKIAIEGPTRPAGGKV